MSLKIRVRQYDIDAMDFQINRPIIGKEALSSIKKDFARFISENHGFLTLWDYHLVEIGKKNKEVASFLFDADRSSGLNYLYLNSHKITIKKLSSFEWPQIETMVIDLIIKHFSDDSGEFSIIKE